MDAISKEKIGVCRWNESGTTLDSALPELRDLTDDKEEWRAIIIRYIDENGMATFDSDPQNPFDFLINADFNGIPKESKVPLIRLTNMLGGVPKPDIQFEPKVVREEGRTSRTIYEPVTNKVAEASYERLSAKYQFDGKEPSSIMLCSIRSRKKKEDNIEEAWVSHRESESSEFWKRNQYPSNCRFMVYDYLPLGPVQKEADDFNFWTCVLLLALNEIDSSVLQAYRLYHVKTGFNRARMEDSFQSVINRLRDAKDSINRKIRKNVEEQFSEEKPLPDYRIITPVNIKVTEKEGKKIPAKRFPLFSYNQRGDLQTWEKSQKELEDRVVSSIKSAERGLDQTAARMRGKLTFTVDEVDELNIYQEEDLQEELDKIYSDIVKRQGELPSGKIVDRPDTLEAVSKVKDKLLSRVELGPALAAWMCSFLLLLLSSLPVILAYVKRHYSPAPGCIYLLTGLGILYLFGLLFAMKQKLALNRLIGRYNKIIGNTYGDLVDKSDKYSQYMSDIASHARGTSYLDASSRLKLTRSEVDSSQYMHLRAINYLLSKLKEWGKAFHLDLDFDSPRPKSYAEVDTSISPVDHKMYSFDESLDHNIVLNRSGLRIDSPLSFVDRLEVVREELYDD